MLETETWKCLADSIELNRNTSDKILIRYGGSENLVNKLSLRNDDISYVSVCLFPMCLQTKLLLVFIDKP